MKIKKILCFCLAVLLALVMAPTFARGRATAEDEVEKHSLVPYSFNINPSQYGISPSLVSTYTPFDFSSEARMPGMSFYLPHGEDGQIAGESIQTARVSGLDASEDYSLFAWICYDQYDMHDLFEISLQFADGGSLYWRLDDKAALMDLMTQAEIKNPHNLVDAMFVPHNWVLLELPFAGALVVSSPVSGNTYKDIEGLSVSYTSEETIENREYSVLRFYDLYVAKTTTLSQGQAGQTSKVRVNEKQSYRICEINPFSAAQTESVVVGDQLTFPTLKNAIKYAYEGETDLLGAGHIGEWRVLVQTPSGTQNKTCAFGSSFTFDSEGTYSIRYQCLHDSTQASISIEQSVVVNQLNAIYFSQNNFSVQVGATYRVTVFTSSMFASCSELEFVNSNDALQYEYLGDGIVEVKGMQAGNYTLLVKVTGTRPNGKTDTYQATITFAAVKKPADADLGVRIFIYCILAIFGVVLIVLAIKTLVKARKIDVK